MSKKEEKFIEKLNKENEIILGFQEYEKKIADLEAKLAESEDCKNMLYKCLTEKDIEIETKKEEIAELQKQLEEKEKEIETILKENEELVIKHNVYNWGDKIQQDKVYSVTGEALDLLINRQTQKAIEQLEKVKSAFGLINSKLDKVEAIKEYIHYIDHQINELKRKGE